VDWQLVLVALCVAAAAAYVARRTWRAWRGAGAGCGGCRCAGPAPQAKAAPLISAADLTARLRRPG
jgi:hypothetical protein